MSQLEASVRTKYGRIFACPNPKFANIMRGELNMSALVPDELAAVLGKTPELAKSFLVGGCVRDWLLNIPNKDFDIEVFGVGYEELAAGLSRWGRPDFVGRSFGVV